MNVPLNTPLPVPQGLVPPAAATVEVISESIIATQV